MDETDDIELLRQYAEEQSEAAFALLVQRYVNLVYSAARRSVDTADQAEEITQAVFIILARKAGRLRSGTILSGWLYQTSRLTAANFRRAEIRRALRENEAHQQSLMNETEPDPWPHVAPLLEEAVGQLREAERNAIVCASSSSQPRICRDACRGEGSMTARRAGFPARCKTRINQSRMTINCALMVM